jgi:hypothetical protein
MFVQGQSRVNVAAPTDVVAAAALVLGVVADGVENCESNGLLTTK